jgi:hypothetical protein
MADKIVTSSEETSRIFATVRQVLNPIFDFFPGKEFLIAGGLVTNLLFELYHGRPFVDYASQDIDIYCQDESELNVLIDTIKGHPRLTTCKSGAFVDKFAIKANQRIIVDQRLLPRRIDLIKGLQGDPGNIFDTFDFLQCAVGVSNNYSYYLEGAIDCIKNKKIKIQTVHYAERTMQRLLKYHMRGFSISEAEMNLLYRQLKHANSSYKDESESSYNQERFSSFQWSEARRNESSSIKLPKLSQIQKDIIPKRDLISSKFEHCEIVHSSDINTLNPHERYVDILDF